MPSVGASSSCQRRDGLILRGYLGIPQISVIGPRVGLGLLCCLSLIDSFIPPIWLESGNRRGRLRRL